MISEDLHANDEAFIHELLAAGKSPILPFERIQLRAELTRYGVQQDTLSRLLNEAMEQSSETWHDNAPADAINHQSRILVKQAEQIISYLGAAVIIGYPNVDYERITIGSVVSIVRSGHSAAENYLFSGLSRTLPNLQPVDAFPNDLDVITIHSPIGSVLLGSSLGDVVTYSANDREHEVEVSNIAQLTAQNIGV